MTSLDCDKKETIFVPSPFCIVSFLLYVYCVDNGIHAICLNRIVECANWNQSVPTNIPIKPFISPFSTMKCNFWIYASTVCSWFLFLHHLVSLSRHMYLFWQICNFDSLVFLSQSISPNTDYFLRLTTAKTVKFSFRSSYLIHQERVIYATLTNLQHVRYHDRCIAHCGGHREL